MKAAITCINSKYIHSSLAPWYLMAGVSTYAKEEHETVVREFTINQSVEDILQALTDECADIYAFCTYIWNIRTLRILLPLLKERVPRCEIVLGGPEASFNAQTLLRELPVSFVLSGEGEESFPLLLDKLSKGESWQDIDGLQYLSEGVFVEKPPAFLRNLPPDPYTDAYFKTLNGRIVYLEGSRGCPFSCAFCLSGREDTLRLFPIERVKRDILRLAVSGTKTIKFVDRTFNCRKDRCQEILRFILSEYGLKIPMDICFHFEVAADLFDEETLSLLETAPKGLFQMEVGLQSFHRETLEAVTRKTNLDVLCQNVRRILKSGNIHLHIDLIAGLPHESLDIFKESFDAAFSLQPHMLQLGFLKLLHGSALRQQISENGYSFSEYAPYEVYASRWMQADEFRLLHLVEDVVERLYNSGRFSRTIRYVQTVSGSPPFELFSRVALFLQKQNVDITGVTLDAYTEWALKCFLTFEGVDELLLRDQLIVDSLTSKQLNRLPVCLAQQDKRIAKIKRLLSKSCEDAPFKRAVAFLHAHPQEVAVVNYSNRDPVTGQYPLQMLPLSQFEL